MATNQIRGLDKNDMLGRGLLNEHFKLSIIANFHFSHNKSMVTVSCHSKQSSHLIETKNTYLFPGLYMLHVKFGKNWLHGFRDV